MAILPTMPVHTDAILSDAGDLPNDLFGAYCRLLFRWWREGANPEPDERRLARWARLSSAEFEDIKEFLTKTDAGWTQRKLVETYAATMAKSERARKAANARHGSCGRNADAMQMHAKTHADASPEHMLEACENSAEIAQNGQNHADAMQMHAKTHANASKMACLSDAIQSQSQRKKEQCRGEEFWGKYPHPPNRGSKRKAVEGIDRLSEAEQTTAIDTLPRFLEVVAAQRKKIHDYTPPMAQTYVLGRRWEALGEAVVSASPQPVPEHPDQKCAPLWARMRALWGDAQIRAWFMNGEAPALQRDGEDGFVIFATGLKADRIAQQYAPVLNDIIGKKRWKIRPP